jgi:hypothetical protein
MRYVTSTIAAIVLASTVGVFAQDQAPSQQPPRDEVAPGRAEPREQAPPQQAAPPKATLTGCVMQAKTTSGTTAYLLTKAQGGSATTYVLAESTESNWSANVNKKVEVTGPVQEPPAANKDAAADPKVIRPPLVLVESMKVVDQTCS